MREAERNASKIGAVVIGRNEGHRLPRCLASGVREAPLIVYVDSGSVDDSVKLARSFGVEVLELDSKSAFSAARARNEGLARLRQMDPNLTHVQFVDGDCELRSGWLASAAAFLDSRQDVAVVSGRLREKDPKGSIYRMLCDIEWDLPEGEVKGCGGIAMMRVSAIGHVQGFRVDLIAGEEPELCLRMRAQGWRIWRLSDEMALHDSAMSHFGQWWKRMQRGGYANAQGANLHGAPPEKLGIRELRSALFWGLGIPSVALGSVILIGPIGLVIFASYPLQVVRLAVRGARSNRENWWHALFLVVGKFPELFGHLQFLLRRGLGRRVRLIEYK
jgi:GT2 family glycosyltransferase